MILETSDFLTASILSYFNHALKSINRDNPKKMVFCFAKEEETDQLLNLFYQEELLIEPKKFTDIQRNLKRRMFA